MGQFNIKKMPERSEQQLNDLQKWCGYTQTQIVLIAVERLWLEVKKERDGKQMQNPSCRVLLKGEKTPRENVEVFSNNAEYGIAFLENRQVHVTSGWGGWYESGMQLLEAEARLTQS